MCLWLPSTSLGAPTHSSFRNRSGRGSENWTAGKKPTESGPRRLAEILRSGRSCTHTGHLNLLRKNCSPSGRLQRTACGCPHRSRCDNRRWRPHVADGFLDGDHGGDEEDSGFTAGATGSAPLNWTITTQRIGLGALASRSTRVSNAGQFGEHRGRQPLHPCRSLTGGGIRRATASAERVLSGPRTSSCVQVPEPCSPTPQWARPDRTSWPNELGVT